MTLLVGGEHAALAGVPKHWRGPIPNPFVTRMLKPKGSFYKKIPMSLLASGAPDLGVMVWALLRLSFDGQANVGSYRRFAQCLNLDHLTDTAIDKRFGPALRPLLGKWITRKRLPDNSYLYEAKVPAAAASDRYAILRPSDVDLLAVTPPKGLTSIEVGDLVDFCRWQLECGRRGWTIEPLRRIADRWKVTHPAIARSRDRLAKLGLLKVVPRTGGRFSDLIWLEELYDPHWQVPSIIDEKTDQGQAGDNDGGGTDRGELWNVSGRFLGTSVTVSLEREREVGGKVNGRSVGSSAAGPIQGIPTEYSTEDSTDLGGASATPLRSVPRESRDAPPAASRAKSHESEPEPVDPHRLSARLLSRHPVFANAKPHFRRAVISRLAVALENGLAPGHADRALARVAEEGAFDAEFLLFRRALQQARADQLTGMCADCGGDANAHRRGCTEFTDRALADPPRDEPVDDHRPVTETGSSPLAADPLTILLQRPLPVESELTDEASMVEWLIVQFARQLVEVSDREARLRAIVVGMRAKAPPGQRELVDLAAQHVRLALTRGLAS